MVNGYVLHARDWWPASWWSRRGTGLTTDRGLGQGAGGLQWRGLFNCRGLLWHDIGTLKWKVHVSWRRTRHSSIMILCVHAWFQMLVCCQLIYASIAHLLPSYCKYWWQVTAQAVQKFFFWPSATRKLWLLLHCTKFQCSFPSDSFLYTALDLPWLEVCHWSMHTHLVKQIGTIHVLFIDSHRFNKFQDRTPFRLIWTAENLVHKSTDQLHVHPVQSVLNVWVTLEEMKFCPQEGWLWKPCYTGLIGTVNIITFFLGHVDESVLLIWFYWSIWLGCSSKSTKILIRFLTCICISSSMPLGVVLFCSLRQCVVGVQAIRMHSNDHIQMVTARYFCRGAILIQIWHPKLINL
jgi:hypothetical protein